MKNGDLKFYLSAYHNEVTGSRILLGISFPDGREYRILIDCGYFQEIQYRYLNYVDDIDPSTIDAILVTHNHIDHTGLLPKLVRQGYKNPIYMTEITRQLLPKFLLDSADQQEDNAKYLKEKFPGDEWKFNALYHRQDVSNTLRLCVGVDFLKTVEIFPGVQVTFLVNGHILGSSMIVIECMSYGRKPLNFFFTGDYKLSNAFFDVPKLPQWVLKKELIMIHESTYGTTTVDQIKVCFIRNMLEGFKRKQDILIGAFAQARMQEILFELKKLQDQDLIPDEYQIYIDGPLGINTTYKYESILKEFSPESSDFIPRGVNIVNPKARDSFLESEGRKILVTTSGMLSNGPAKQYVPMFLERENAMIHLTGYAAEETLARTLLEAKRSETITISGKTYQKRAVIKTTREKTSHVTQDEMIRFINQFENIAFLAINHGANDVKGSLEEVIKEKCPNVDTVDILNRDYMYTIYQHGYTGDDFSNLSIKKIPSKLHIISPNERKERKAAKKKKMRRDQKAKKKAAKRKLKNKRK